jgi:hypothetical protein
MVMNINMVMLTIEIQQQTNLDTPRVPKNANRPFPFFHLSHILPDAHRLSSRPPSPHINFHHMFILIRDEI